MKQQEHEYFVFWIHLWTDMAQLKVVSGPKLLSLTRTQILLSRIDHYLCSALFCLLDLTSSVALRVFGEAANHSLHRLLQHRRVPRVTVAGSPRTQPRSHTAVQAVELQRGWRRGRPGRGGQGGRRGQERRDGDRNPGPERWAQGPGRSGSESNPRLQPLRADTVRDHVRFHCPHVMSAKSGSGGALYRSTPTVRASAAVSRGQVDKVGAEICQSQPEETLIRCGLDTQPCSSASPVWIRLRDCQSPGAFRDASESCVPV